jgi:hypothetical protein
VCALGQWVLVVIVLYKYWKMNRLATLVVCETGWMHSVLVTRANAALLGFAITGRHRIARGNFVFLVLITVCGAVAGLCTVHSQCLLIFYLRSAHRYRRCEFSRSKKSGKSAKNPCPKSRRGGTASARQVPMSGTTCASAVFLQCHWSALAPDLTFFRYVNIRLTEELVIAGFKKEPVIEVSTVTVSITLFCHG